MGISCTAEAFAIAGVATAIFLAGAFAVVAIMFRRAGIGFSGSSGSTYNTSVIEVDDIPLDYAPTVATPSSSIASKPRSDCEDIWQLFWWGAISVAVAGGVLVVVYGTYVAAKFMFVKTEHYIEKEERADYDNKPVNAACGGGPVIGNSRCLKYR